MHKFDFTGLAELTAQLCESKVPVYLTIDLDCLDPVSYTHLDVYKRQEPRQVGIGHRADFRRPSRYYEIGRAHV